MNSNIKACLKQNIEITDDDAKLLINEAELLAKVHHTSLPAFRDLYRAQDNSMILAMSFIEGKSLDKIIEKHKALHPEEVSWIAQRSLNALFYLHHEGIIHGDVKPPNLLIEHKKHNADGRNEHCIDLTLNPCHKLQINKDIRKDCNQRNRTPE